MLTTPISECAELAEWALCRSLVTLSLKPDYVQRKAGGGDTGGTASSLRPSRHRSHAPQGKKVSNVCLLQMCKEKTFNRNQPKRKENRQRVLNLVQLSFCRGRTVKGIC